MTLARKSLAAGTLVLGVGLFALSCSTSGKTTSSTGSGGATGTASSSTGGISSCTPACTAPQVGSVAGSCINPGMCLANGDCPMGEICDLPTKKCVPGGGCGQQEAT